MSKYLRLTLSGWGGYRYFYPYYYDSTGDVSIEFKTDKLYPPIPYYFNGYLIKDTNGVGHSDARYSGGTYYQGVRSYTPENNSSRYVGIDSSTYSGSNYNTRDVYFCPVCLYKYEGDDPYEYITHHMSHEICDGVDVSLLKFRPVGEHSQERLYRTEADFWGYSDYQRVYPGYFIDAPGKYGDFSFVGFGVSTYSDVLTFIKDYPDLTDCANPSCDKPSSLSEYGATMENVLHGVGEGNYIQVDVDSDTLDEITFENGSEVPEFFYQWLLKSFDIVYTGAYAFKTASGETIQTLTEKPRITHYDFTVSGDEKILLLTYANGLQDRISWESTAPIEGYGFAGMQNENGSMIFVPNVSEDVDIYGAYTFTEVWEYSVKPGSTFDIVLYRLTGDKKLLNKDNYLSKVLTVGGALKKECSVVDPVIMISMDLDTGYKEFASANYAYIEEFHRYYFITDVTIYRTGLFIVSMHCDVLMTYKNSVLYGSRIKVERASDYRNSQLADPMDIIEPGNEINVIDFTDMSDEIQPFLDGYRLTDVETYKYTVDYRPLNEFYSEKEIDTNTEYVYILTVLGDNNRFYDGYVDTTTTSNSVQNDFKIEPFTGKDEKDT